IDWQLSSSDYARARQLLAGAAAEFPGDPELAELEKLAAQGLQRSAEAQRLLGAAQELCAHGRFDHGIETLRQAHRLDERNSAVRTTLTTVLVEQARARLDTDWRASESLAQQAIALDPANTQAKSIESLALDRKREEFVNHCVAQARRLQAEGQLDS